MNEQLPIVALAHPLGNGAGALGQLLGESRTPGTLLEVGFLPHLQVVGLEAHIEHVGGGEGMLYELRHDRGAVAQEVAEHHGVLVRKVAGRARTGW